VMVGSESRKASYIEVKANRPRMGRPLTERSIWVIYA
jgi:hypothetical protein